MPAIARQCIVAVLIVAASSLAACGVDTGPGSSSSLTATPCSFTPQGYDVLAYAPDADAKDVLKVGGEASGAFTFGGLAGNDGVWAFDPLQARWVQLAGTAPHQADGAAYRTRRGGHPGEHDFEVAEVQTASFGDGEEGEHELSQNPDLGEAKGEMRAGALIAWFSFAPPIGIEFAEPLAETWAFNWRTRQWTNLSPTVSPPPGLFMDGAQIVYDQRSDKLIMFGGIDLVALNAFLNNPSGVDFSTLFTNHTWAYDYRSNRWIDMQPANSPPPRASHALVYDKHAKRVILFGGHDLFGAFGDTWAYDFQRNTWTELTPANSPPARAYASMAYDARSKFAVLFGGIDINNGFAALGDTWVYDHGRNAWTKRSPATSPSPRGFFGMTYDQKANVVVLFGGGPDQFSFTDETWSYSTASDSWVQVQPTCAVVAPRVKKEDD